MAEEMADYLELIILSFSVGNVVFEKIVTDNVSLLNIVATIIAGVIWILPNGIIADYYNHGMNKTSRFVRRICIHLIKKINNQKVLQKIQLRGRKC